jgi:hypothetical protein
VATSTTTLTPTNEVGGSGESADRAAVLAEMAGVLFTTVVED